MTKQISKTCPSPECGKVDVTDFSTCRHCGHKYDGSTERTVSGLAAHMPAVGDTKGLAIWLTAISLVIVASVFIVSASRTRRFDRLETIRQSIIAAGRPRAIFLLKDWSSTSSGYVNTVNNEAQKYGNVIDFSKLSIDDPMNKELLEALSVQYLPITAIFDRRGRESKTISGQISQSDLDHYLRDALQQGVEKESSKKN